MFRIRSVLQGATLLLVPVLLHAQGKSGVAKGPSVASADRQRQAPHGVAGDQAFRDPDRTVFRDYFHSHGFVVTPLPPGIAKNLARGKPLPPGIAKKAFPRNIIPVRPGAGRDVVFVMVGNHVVAMRNGVVVDVMPNVFP